MSELDEPTYRCRASLEGQRCSYRGTRDELDAHADGAGHPRCIVCGRTLEEFEQQTCDRCANVVRDDLIAVAVAYAHLERAIWETAYRTGQMPGGDALVYLADGSVERPMHAYEINELAPHPLARDDEMPPPQIRDEWKNDPLSVLAVLEANERDWRHEFGHGPAVDLATVAGCLAYLRDWHTLAARTHPGFDDYADEIRRLRVRLEHVVALADDPVSGAPCGCGTALRRNYGEDDWICRNCGLTVTRTEYLWRLRLAVHLPGWASLSEAAGQVDRPMRTVQAWARDIEDPQMVPTVCHRLTRRVMVELAAVKERDAETPRRMREAS